MDSLAKPRQSGDDQKMPNETLPEFDAEERRRKAEAASNLAAQSMTAQPMAAAPIRYTEDGSVDWGNMWDSFCALALTGGPSHRGTDSRVTADITSDPNTPVYKNVVDEIVRGVYLVSGLKARADTPGWVAIECASEGMASWLGDAARAENMEFRNAGNLLFAPCGANFRTEKEIKSVVTVVAKTTHYWQDHIPNDVKTTMVFEDRLNRIGQGIRRIFGKKG